MTKNGTNGSNGSNGNGLSVMARLAALRDELAAAQRAAARVVDPLVVATAGELVAAREFKAGGVEYSRGDLVALPPQDLERLARHRYLTTPAAYAAGRNAKRLKSLLNDDVFPIETARHEAAYHHNQAAERLTAARAALAAAEEKYQTTAARLAEMEAALSAAMEAAEELTIT